jgi:biopolymer transport protein ExbD/biopolymer transport protein TolR
MASLGGLGRRHRGRPLNAEVNIINLVDVMLVLLIIFMVTAPIMQGGITVQLPRAASRPVHVPDAITVTVDRNGAVAVGSNRVESLETFRNSFGVFVQARHPGGVYIRGDEHARFGDVVRVLDIVRAAGITKASIVTEAASP